VILFGPEAGYTFNEGPGIVKITFCPKVGGVTGVTLTNLMELLKDPYAKDSSDGSESCKQVVSIALNGLTSVQLNFPLLLPSQKKIAVA